MLIDVRNPWCWICGRDERQSPEWWYAPWMVHRAHVVNKPRVADRRAVVLLCPVCHGVAHGQRFAAAPELPEIGLSNLLWAKLKRDFRYYDRPFLARHTIGRLPIADPPAPWYVDQYCQRRGL